MKFLNSLFIVLLARAAVKDSVDDATIETKWSEFKVSRCLRYHNSSEENEKKSNFAYHYRQMVAANKTVSFELRPNDHFTEGKDVFDKMKGLVLSPHFKQQLCSLPRRAQQKRAAQLNQLFRHRQPPNCRAKLRHNIRESYWTGRRWAT